MLAVFTIAAVMGALLFYQQTKEVERSLFLMLALFASVGYAGVALSNGYLNVISDGWFQTLWLIGVAIFIVMALKTYHPIHGFFDRRDYRIWIAVLLVFFLTGTLVNVWVSLILTYLFFVIVCAAGILIGYLAQGYLHAYWPSFKWLPFVPLLLLIFVSTGKLL